jgi:hypothetical protein
LQRVVHDENIAYYKKLIAESERDPSRDNARHNVLSLADELAKMTEWRSGRRYGMKTLRHAQTLPNQVYGGGCDHHPRRDDESLLDPVHATGSAAY